MLGPVLPHLPQLIFCPMTFFQGRIKTGRKKILPYCDGSKEKKNEKILSLCFSYLLESWEEKREGAQLAILSLFSFNPLLSLSFLSGHWNDFEGKKEKNRNRRRTRLFFLEHVLQ